MKVFNAIVLAILVSLTACNSETSSGDAVSDASATQASPKPATWNLEDPDALTNGNIDIAIAAILQGIETSKEDAAPAQVMKRPWDFYGKKLCFSGQAMIVQDFPPGNVASQVMGGSTSEIVFGAPDGTIIDALVKGSSGASEVGKPITICGMPAGRVTVNNQLGGQTTQLYIVGEIK